MIKLFGLRLKIYIELNALPVYDNRYTKTKITRDGDKVYTNFCGLNVKDDLECEYFTVISTVLTYI